MKNALNTLARNCQNVLEFFKTQHKIYKPNLFNLNNFCLFFHCNQLSGKSPLLLEIIVLIQKKLVRIITCCAFRALKGANIF